MELIKDDSLIYLKTLNENSIDSLVTDPPAFISFMGKEWDGFDKLNHISDIFKECYRVLKPGAYGVVWALPRTSHHTAKALEDSGFEIRDIIHHVFGTGFPKSHNISKGFDKKAGVEREVIGIDKSAVRKNAIQNNTNSTHNAGFKPEGSGVITCPATDLAKKYEGFGTALKPAVEHWLLVRKPLSEKTVVDNVEKWGTGGLNLDRSRVYKHSMGSDHELCQLDNLNSLALIAELKRNLEEATNKIVKEFFAQKNATSLTLENPHGIPQEDISSMVISCLEEILMGNTSINLNTFMFGKSTMNVQSQRDLLSTIKMRINQTIESKILSSWQLGTILDIIKNYISQEKMSLKLVLDKLENIEQERKKTRFPSNLTHDGSEEVEREFLEQSEKMGMTKAGNKSLSLPGKINGLFNIGGVGGPVSKYNHLNEEMTASRFFNSLPDDIDTTFIYQPKASTSERNRGLEGITNKHPTIKSIALMSHLIKLTTPPNGICLDPFMGSGSTGVAAVKNGFDFIGIEQNKEYFEIAKARIESSKIIS